MSTESRTLLRSSESLSESVSSSWRDSVVRVSILYQARYPRGYRMIAQALMLVLAQQVHIDKDSPHVIERANDISTHYDLSSGSCSCDVAETDPDQYCKHRFAVAILRRALRQMQGVSPVIDPHTASLTPSETCEPPAPPAISFTINHTIAGKDVWVTVRGDSVTTLWPQVQEALDLLDASAPL